MGLLGRNRTVGFSLVELSVATAVFSIGLSGLSLMMLTAIRGTDDAHHLTLAGAQADTLAEYIAMNPDAIGHFVNPPQSQPLACLEQGCAPDAMAGAMMAAWQDQVRATLPAGAGRLCRDETFHDGSPANAMCDGNGNLVIKVWWSEQSSGDEADFLQRHTSRLQW